MNVSWLDHAPAPRVRRPPRSGLGFTVAEGTAPLLDVLDEFVLVLGDEAFDRHRKAVGQHADRVALHVGGDADQPVQVGHLAAPGLQIDKQLLDPSGALAAGRALAAGFMMVEVRDGPQAP